MQNLFIEATHWLQLLGEGYIYKHLITLQIELLANSSDLIQFSSMGL